MTYHAAGGHISHGDYCSCVRLYYTRLYTPLFMRLSLTYYLISASTHINITVVSNNLVSSQVIISCKDQVIEDNKGTDQINSVQT